MYQASASRGLNSCTLHKLAGDMDGAMKDFKHYKRQVDRLIENMKKELKEKCISIVYYLRKTDHINPHIHKEAIDTYFQAN
mmetsp:Transcript_16997/g.20761  ORF Transcript_16997/g.20761 Transcript_16997/m.20761 type:complete len:81 (-) Transcript_16997:84-326(-)